MNKMIQTMLKIGLINDSCIACAKVYLTTFTSILQLGRTFQVYDNTTTKLSISKDNYCITIHLLIAELDA